MGKTIPQLLVDGLLAFPDWFWEATPKSVEVLVSLLFV